jgi:amino acid adenylation domain-containing protein/non-ribosomal peptide synthase protein (TIGR01720 family)
VVIASRQTAADGKALAEAVRTVGATLVQATPATWRLMLAEGWRGGGALKALCGGEALPRDLAEELLATGMSLWNMYGPTETTIWSAVDKVEAGIAAVPIGRPIGNTRIYVLDTASAPAPVGVPGELWIGGTGLARGYLNQADLTAERFVPDPFGAPGGRLYRTGDLARWLPDGRLECLGRLDHQVKVRGFRIEPEEIESVLARHSGVREALVLAREDAPGNKRLVAYVVPHASEAPEPADLRSWLRRELPEYMVPAAFLVIEALPRTPNGKVDRRALPDPGDRADSAAYRAPRTPVEGILAEIWSDVLGIERVGVDDRFLDLGGHSLLASRVVSRVRETLQSELPVRALFEAATISELAKQVEAHRLSAAGLRLPPLVRRERLVPPPLSFAQQRLWFLDRLDPGAATYNIPFALLLQGPLCLPALRAAVAEIVRRHESLRTSFDELEHGPVQRIRLPLALPVPVVNLRALERDSRRREARSLTRLEARRPFDLVHGPLVRFCVVCIDEQEHEFLVTLHHTVSDGGSVEVFLRELYELYAAFSKGRPHLLAELPVQYVDFTLWQRSWLAGDLLQEQLAYWKDRLSEVPVLDLPTDRARPAVQTFQGALYNLTLPRALSDSLRELSRREGVSLFMSLLAGLQALLWRLSGQADITIGLPISGRNWPEIERLIGFFVNTLVLRADLGGEPTLRDLLQQVRTRALEAYDHQDLPFERLVDELQSRRDLSRPGLFQVMFVFQNGALPAADVSGVCFQPAMLGNGNSRFDMTWAMAGTAEGLAVSIEYNTALFDSSTIERVAGYFSSFLEQAVGNPGLQLSAVRLLAPAEHRQILIEWNDTGREIRPDLCLHTWIAAQARATPEDVAVVFEEDPLTYRELDEVTNRLARQLRRLGAGPESHVGIYMERSLELVVALLGTLKTGAAYLPLDPDYPQARLAAMLEDGRAAVLLTQERLLPGAPACDAPVVVLDRAFQALAGESAQALAAGALPDNPAYLIFTSGSTGRPKGVAVPHRGIVNRLLWMKEAYSLTPADRVLQKTPFSFDVSVWELFWPLMAGARLVLARPGGHRDSGYLAELIAREGITNLHFVPSMLTAFLEEPGAVRCESLRRVFCSGEALPSALERRFFERLPGVELHNLYGPTEASVEVTFWACEPAGNRPAVPIGRPITNTQIYVADRRFEPVPVGVAGELLIGGAGLARGYVGRSDLTAERFVPDPFLDQGGRLYRTGDLARWLPEGVVEFLGRLDHQVKIRGFRIELGEIESTLARHGGVREAVVLAREDVPGEMRLVAYAVVSRPDVPSTEELRRFLAGKLPEYMVPSAFVFLDELPLTPNGKLDRKALPPPRLETEAKSHVGPRTPFEELLAGIWAEVLQIDRPGIHDNFFELGGHSLRATQVASRVREALRLEISVRNLFEAPTIFELAGRLEHLLLDQTNLEVPPILPAPRHQPLPLSFAQQRLWVLDRLEPNSSTYNLPFAWRLVGPLSLAALQAALGAVATRHEALRTVFREGAEAPVQVILPPSGVGLQLFDLRALQAEDRWTEARRLARAEVRRPFDLTSGPLMRCLLVSLDEREHILLVTIHHIVYDGWSMGVFLTELAAFYSSFAEGRSAELPRLPIQYADFAVWQRQWLQGEVLDRQLAYWRDHLEGSRPFDLQTDRPRPAVKTSRGARSFFALPPALWSRLAELGQQEKVTLFMVLLAAFKVLLHRRTGETDLTVGTPVAGRNRAELEGLIGFFVNTLALRTILRSDFRFADLLHGVRATTLQAYAHQDVPFEKLLEELKPNRDLSRTPLFQVMFVLQNMPAAAPELRDLALSELRVEEGNAKFDLTFTLAETGTGIAGFVEYNVDLFDEATVRRLLEHFQTVLTSVAADPHRGISGLPLLSEAARHQLMAEWNDTAGRLPGGERLDVLLSRQARSTPEAVAVVGEGCALTYLELEERANRLARHLRRLGVGPEVRVGLCLERSPDLIVGLVAIVKAGGAYVPLDPRYPQERLDFMSADSRLRLLVTERRVSERLPQGLRQVHVDGDGSIEQESSEAPATEGGGESLVYAIYTSGSTGEPKGVMVTHAALANLTRAFTEALGLAPGDRFLMIPSISFDASAGDIFPALTSGATLVLPSNPAELSGEDLERLCDREGVTVLDMPAALWQTWVEDLARRGVTGALPSLRKVIVGGESIMLDRLATWTELTRGRAEVMGTYGPTEATVCSTFRTGIEGLDPRRTARLPIGRPVANTCVHVLDQDLQPVVLGSAGELFIAGAGVARGYLSRPGATAERFLPDSLALEPGGRMYRTGDLVRHLPQGELEFLGRVDQQVKIRGFRVEPDEIGAVLALHPALQEAVIALRGEGDAKRLVAYFVLAPGQQADVAELRSFLNGKLPDYMIPGAFVRLDSLPLSPNGKVDRGRLPAPEHGRGAASSPRTPVEGALVRIWAEVLRLEEVSVDANFFELGGDSILSIQIVSRASRQGLRLTPRQVFQHQTIAELAAVAGIEAAVRVEREEEVIGPVPLTPVQRWFFERDLPERHHWNQAALLEVETAIAPAVWESALAHLIRHHDALRLRFVREAATWHQRNEGVQGRAPFTLLDLSALPAGVRKEGLARAVNALQESLNLEEGPLVRMAALKGLDRPGWLWIGIHHLAVDGVSWRILIEDLQEICSSLAAGHTPELSAKTTSFKTWAERLAEHGRSREMLRELDYWLEQGASAPERRLLHDHSVSMEANTVASARTLSMALTEQETRDLLHEVPKAYHSQIDDVLLTALVEACSAWLGERRLLVHLEGHGREEIFPDVDLSRTVGWFTAGYPVLLDVRGTANPGDALKRVKEKLRQVPNRGLGYGVLRYLCPEPEIRAQLAALPEPEIAFNYLGQLDQAMPQGGLFRPARESAGPAQSPRGQRTYLLEINGAVSGGRLQLGWTYSAGIHHGTTIEKIVQRFLASLRSIIDHCRAAQAGSFTPSDFPLADLKQAQLDKLIQRVGIGKGAMG